MLRFAAYAASSSSLTVFFFNDTATTEIYTLSLHDALPIWGAQVLLIEAQPVDGVRPVAAPGAPGPGLPGVGRSEEHTSELQSLTNLVCRLLLEKKKNTRSTFHLPITVIIWIHARQE